MKMLMAMLAAGGLSGCVAYGGAPYGAAGVYYGGSPYYDGSYYGGAPVYIQGGSSRGYYSHGRRGYDRDGDGVADRRDRDGDGIADRRDRDRDGDGVSNRRDSYPSNPRRR